MAWLLLVGRDGRIRQPTVEKVERRGVVLAHGGAHAAVVLADELRQEVLELGRLGLVGEPVVGDGGGPADLVDPDDQRLQALQRLVRPDVQDEQPDGHQREAHQGDLLVAGEHDRRAVVLDVAAAGLAVFVASRWDAGLGTWLSRASADDLRQRRSRRTAR